MAKKTARQRATKRCDDAFSRYIRARDGYRCYCANGPTPCSETMTCGHLITRTKMATRWDTENAQCQCTTHNNLHEHYPELFTANWIAEHGRRAYEALILKAWTPTKYSVAEIEEMAASFDAMTAELSRRDLV